MIDLNTTNEWQFRDAEGLVLPWYTKSFLDELVTWDLKEKVVFEYGAGASTVWWDSKCRNAFAVESNIEYLNAVRNEVNELSVYFACTKETYLKFITKPRVQYDIVVVDGDPIEWRDNCVTWAIDYLKPGGRLIIDNWDQKSVWVPSDETRKLLADWLVKIYPQEGHPDWKTLVATKI